MSYNISQSVIDGKQETLVSATNIKTINGSSVLGSGNLVVGGGSGDMVLASTQTVSGLKTFLSTMFGLRNVADTFTAFFTNTITANRTYTLKDADGTLAFTTDITGVNSGTNTGDETTATIKTKLGTASTSTDGYLLQADWNTFNNKVSYVAPTISLELLTQATNQTITAGYSSNINRKYTINSGIKLTIRSGAIFRIN